MASHGPPRHQEYTICIDSRNRDLILYPEPNDFKLDINFSRGLPVQRIYLGSIELPLPQYIIEKEWNRIYLSEGLALIVNSENEECLREFTIREWDGTIVRTILPIWLNPIVDVDLSDPTNPIFTTMFEHALDLRGQWDWGAPIRIISTVLTDPSLIELTEKNPNLSIVSPFSFQLHNVPAVPQLVPNQGYLHAPAIANPEKLANMVTAGLNMQQSTNGSYKIIFDGYRNQFCLKLASFPCALSTQADVNCAPLSSELGSRPVVSPASIVGNNTNCLSFIMGFGCTDLPLPPGEDSVTKGVCGQFCYQCMSYIELKSGNFNVETFPPMLSLEANRFYFEPTCMPGLMSQNLQVPPPTLIFSDECGICNPAIIPFGKYSPESLAQALENAMNGFSATNDYRVDFDAKKGKFTFRTVSGALFGLEFEDPRDKGISFIGGGAREIGMSERLGFTESCYRGENIYMSNRPFHVPTKGCNCTTIPERLLSNVYIPLLSRSKKEFGLNACRTKISNGTLTDQGDGLVRIDTSLFPVPPLPTLPQYAHGFQPEDVINVRDQTTGETYQLVVAEILSATSFLAEVSGVSPFLGANGLDVCVSLFGPVIVNLFFGSLCNVSPFSSSPAESTPFTNFPVNTIKSEITGFPPTAILWNGPTSLPFFAPNQFSLDPPDYLLMEMVEPNESKFIQHRYMSDTITNLFAKLVVYPPLRVERATPMETIFQGLKVVNQLHLRILDPTHRLYNFHGRNWSCSLIFVVSALSGSSVCY